MSTKTKTLLYAATIMGTMATTGLAEAQTRYYARQRLVGMPISTQTAPPATDPAQSAGRWHAGEFLPWSSTCSATAVRTRSVECRDASDAPASETSCTEPKPDAQEGPTLNTSDCSDSIRNGGFENGGASWAGVGLTTSTPSRSGAVAGAITNSGSAYAEQTIGTIPDVPYTITYWINTGGTNRSVAIYDKSSSTISNRITVSNFTTATTAGWTRFSISWTARSSISVFRVNQQTSGGSAGNKILLDDVSIVAN